MKESGDVKAVQRSSSQVLTSSGLGEFSLLQDEMQAKYSKHGWWTVTLYHTSNYHKYRVRLVSFLESQQKLTGTISDLPKLNSQSVSMLWKCSHLVPLVIYLTM